MREFAASPNAKTIFMPVEISSLVGTVGGIGELVKAARGDDAPPAGRASVPSVRRPAAVAESGQ